jgi:hypothetical protein
MRQSAISTRKQITDVRVACQDKPAGGEAGTRVGLTEFNPDGLFARPLARLELWILEP